MGFSGASLMAKAGAPSHKTIVINSDTYVEYMGTEYKNPIHEPFTTSDLVTLKLMDCGDSLSEQGMTFKLDF